MTRSFANPYIIFYPLQPRVGTSFPVNKAIREIQGRAYTDQIAWRGNVVIAKYRGGAVDPFMSLVDISMADFPILKNFLATRGPTRQVSLTLKYILRSSLTCSRYAAVDHESAEQTIMQRFLYLNTHRAFQSFELAVISVRSST